VRRGDPELAAQIEVESAGTSGYHVGEQADERMRQTARARGVALDHRARQFRKADFRSYDLIVAMDRHNAAELQRLAAGDATALAKVRLLREFEPEAPARPSSPPEDVPDPYYGGERGFHEVFDIADRCCRVLYERIRDGTFGPV